MVKGRRKVTYSENFSKNENAVIKRVLDRYNFNIISCKKARSAYKVQTTDGNIFLKRFKHGRNKAENGSVLVEELAKNDFHNTAQFIKTKNDNLFVKYRKFFFYATEWINGDECELSQIDEAHNCAKLLAEFHLAASKIDTKKIRIQNNLKNWPQIYRNKLYDLPKYEKIISKKKIKNDFDLTYMNNIENFYNTGLITLRILNDSEYYRLSKKAEKEHTICHNSFYYQNIIKKENEYYIIDLDSIIIDLQVNDLGKFIRRLMSKREYKWDFEKAKKIIEGYNSVNKLTKGELKIMLALIIFPHKFWKLGRKRYIKYKNWSEQKYSHKLNKVIHNGELQQKFLEDYLKFLDSYTYE
ncbi:CotS family spore coat protein [Clostridium ganghwense]|uniref:CotS family spore coat protein n=1 Tax=Clostridium ganghwense TaxID=312089 RepID=A0ABT4CTZ7_9CLOT|nr:CotS family spore coat protein [Clostridium ganghwense]MCY6372548.1 CotS family spore coat protein [Clostridium ganghwense]